jgi:hypothetical protein
MSAFQVRVHAIGDQSGGGVLRVLSELGIADGVSLVDHIVAHAPCILMSGVNQEIAEHVIEAISRSGGSAEIELSPTNDPMVLCPDLNSRSLWNRTTLEASAATV